MQREDFARRFEQGQPISLHELLYPLAQAYDSVAIRADVEMGGQDQTFNILAGRHLQEQEGQEPQVALFMPILVGLDGVKKMSKSLGNYVGVTEPPGEMFGKLMSITDEMMREYFVLCTEVPLDEIEHLLETAREGRVNPKDAKRRLAREVVTLYHGAEAAQAADEEFERIHGSRRDRDAVPDDAPEIAVPAEAVDAAGQIRITALLVVAGMAASSGEARRLVQQGGVSLDGEKITDVNQTILVQTGQVLRTGRHRFARLLPPVGA